MKPKISVENDFSKLSKQHYDNVHGPLKEFYQNIRIVLDKCLEGTVVDIGNGGIFTYDTTALEKIIVVDQVYAEEIQNTEKITVFTGDARDLSFLENEKVDCVLMQFLLHHIVEKTPEQMDESLKKALTEAHRILKPKGKLIIVEPIVFRILELYENLFYRVNSYILGLFNVPMVRFYSRKNLLSHIETAGYCDLRSDRIPLGKSWLPLTISLFPDKLRVPPWLYPTRSYCITASKK
jgi:SAM-dependent methyltransferase